MSGTIAITMAGFGSRFVKKGFTLPKYEIEAFGLTLFEWSMISLSKFKDAGWEFSFAVRSDDNAEEFIKEKCKKLNFNISSILSLNEPTDGQATTAYLLAQKAIKNKPFAVFNIDTFINPNSLPPSLFLPNIDGWIPCFKGKGDFWSFAKVNSAGHVTELREKERISDIATLGFYWFRDPPFYMATYYNHFIANSGEKGERYIAPMYNEIISRGGVVKILDISINDVVIFGTPEQLSSILIDKPRCLADFILC